jgi:hypothetical protein
LLTRRLAVSACALCFVVPATAVAQSSPDPAGGQAALEVTGVGAYRIANAAGPVAVTGAGSYDTGRTAGSPVTATGIGSYGTTESAPSQVVVTGAGSYATAKSAGSQTAVTGLGGYSTAGRSQVAVTGFGAYRTDGPARAAVASNGGGTDGWQMTALSEAVLLAAFALGSVLILRARRAAPGVGA